MRGGWIDSFCLPYSYSGWVDEPAFGLGGAEFSAFACALCTFVDRGGSSNRDGSDWIQLIHRNNNNNNKRYKFLATFTDTIKMNVLRWFQLWCVLNSQGVPSEYFVKFERISVVKNFSSLQYYVSLPISDSKGSSTQNVLTWTGHRDLKVPPPPRKSGSQLCYRTFPEGNFVSEFLRSLKKWWAHAPAGVGRELGVYSIIYKGIEILDTVCDRQMTHSYSIVSRICNHSFLLPHSFIHHPPPPLPLTTLEALSRVRCLARGKERRERREKERRRNERAREGKEMEKWRLSAQY